MTAASADIHLPVDDDNEERVGSPPYVQKGLAGGMLGQQLAPSVACRS